MFEELITRRFAVTFHTGGPRGALELVDRGFAMDA